MKKLGKGTYLGRNSFESNNDGIILTINEYEEGLHSSWHYHENTYFTLIQKGGSVERRRKESIKCRPGMLLFYNFEEAHSNEKYQAHSRNFSVEIEDSWYKKFDIDKRKLPGCFVVEDIVAKNLIINIYKETLVNDQYSNLGIEGLLLQLVTQMLREERPKKQPEWVEKIKELILYEDAENLNLKYLSKQIQLHPVTLSKEFSHYFNCNFSDFIRKMKCQKACSLLSIKHLPIEQIAWECGFTDSSHLAKVFQSIYHISPSDYRRTLS